MPAQGTSTSTCPDLDAESEAEPNARSAERRARIDPAGPPLDEGNRMVSQQPWPAVPPAVPPGGPDGNGGWWDPLQAWDAELQRSGRVVIPAASRLRHVAIGLAAFSLMLCLCAAIGFPLAFGLIALLFVTPPFLICAALSAVVLVQQIGYLRRHLVVTVHGIEVTGLATVPWQHVLGAKVYVDAVQIVVLSGRGSRVLQVGTLEAQAGQVVAWIEMVQRRMLAR